MNLKISIICPHMSLRDWTVGGEPLGSVGSHKLYVIVLFAEGKKT